MNKLYIEEANGIKRKILIADDDSDITRIICDVLCGYEYDVEIAQDTTTAYEMLAENKYDMIILDVCMPDESGLDFCRNIRKISPLPVIFISARDTEDDKVKGLNIGGDDYIGKPFSLKELLSRVNSLMRRTYGTGYDEGVIKVGDIEIDTVKRNVRKKENEIKLSLKEFDVLAYLAKNKNQVVKKSTLFNEVWGMFCECEASTLSVHIRWLREKLEDDPAKPRYIKTVWGVGFSLSDGDRQ